MKKLLLITALLFIATQTGAGMQVMTVGGGVPAVAGCSGSYGNQLTTDAGHLGDGALQCFVSQITGACNGTTASITIRFYDYSPTVENYRAYAVIYADSAGSPGALLGSAQMTASEADPHPSWKTTNIAVATGSTTFWIGWCGEAWIAAEYSATTGGTTKVRYNITAYTSPPNPWTANGTADTDYDAYNFATYVTY